MKAARQEMMMNPRLNKDIAIFSKMQSVEMGFFTILETINFDFWWIWDLKNDFI